ncbi:hypothetical protein VB712_12885 [Spirulina sp. CCNP1310]|uniref:hypothetical protein n=1 Tax=Spirulina sp. CCNP1310 TaxID=3110249 RepID=UPI002B2067AC|nr:hypothetical protein [Spirulina sp. CCNP1310]MEA5420119.1 hypothetical protein [Spirulina sp. CCNP1310]
MASPGLGVEIIALAVTLAGVETLHGILRTALIAPRLGTRRAKRLSIISGTALLFGVCWWWIPRLGLSNPLALLALGAGLAGFMGLYDLLLGHYVFKMKWRVLWRDFDPRQGNYLSIGLLILVFIPWLVMMIHNQSWAFFPYQR